jgi:hypothetical protein
VGVDLDVVEQLEADEFVPSSSAKLAQGGSWLYTQLSGKIKTARKIARAAIKAMKNIDDVQLRDEEGWRRATQVRALALGLGLG